MPAFKNEKKEILPPIYFLIFLIAQLFLHFALPLKKIIIPLFSNLGYLLILLGIILDLWTDSLFKKNKTTVKPFEKPVVFITKGPFKISRHPMYLGFVLILLGIAFVFGSLTTFIMPILLPFVLEKMFISKEEKNLKKMFGVNYLDYKKTTRKWI